MTSDDLSIRLTVKRKRLFTTRTANAYDHDGVSGGATGSWQILRTRRGNAGGLGVRLIAC